MIKLSISFDASEIKSLGETSEQIEWAIQRMLAKEAELAARDMKQEMASQKLAATSLLINSVKADQVDPMEWRVGPHVAYARYVLEGRKPGGKMPPWRAIQDWLKVRRLENDRDTAWAVARALQRRGVKARDYLTPVATYSADRLLAAGATAIVQALPGS